MTTIEKLEKLYQESLDAGAGQFVNDCHAQFESPRKIKIESITFPKASITIDLRELVKSEVAAALDSGGLKEYAEWLNKIKSELLACASLIDRL